MRRDLLFEYCTGPCFKEEALDKIVERNFPQGVANLNILDVGCRNGEWLNVMQKRGAKVHGVDICQKSLEEGRKRFPLLVESFTQTSVQEVFASGVFKQIKFDLIFCFGTLCYLDNNEQIKAMNQMFRLLKNEGEIWISIPKPFSNWQKGLIKIVNTFPIWWLNICSKLVSPFMYLLDFIFYPNKKVFYKNYGRYWGLFGLIGLSTQESVLHNEKKIMHEDFSPLCSKSTSHVYCFKQSDIFREGFAK